MGIKCRMKSYEHTIFNMASILFYAAVFGSCVFRKLVQKFIKPGWIDFGHWLYQQYWDKSLENLFFPVYSDTVKYDEGKESKFLEKCRSTLRKIQTSADCNAIVLYCMCASVI